MKKLFLILTLIILLGGAVYLGFRFTTSNGLFVENTYLIDADGHAVLSENKNASDTPLLDTIKSREKISAPDNTTANLSIKASFKADFVMSYEIYYNPYTGTGYIEKGLIKKSFYKIPDETMSLLLNVEKSEITTDDITIELITDTTLIKMIKSGRAVQADPDKINSSLPKYLLTETLFGGVSVQGELIGDADKLEVFFKTSEYIYRIPSPEAEQILSQYPFYDSFGEVQAVIPETGLKAENILSSSFSEIVWTRLKPDGNPSTFSMDELNKATLNISPGTLFSMYTTASDPPDLFTLDEYRDGELYKTYSSIDETITVPYFEGTLKYVLTAEFKETASSNSYGTITKEYYYQMDFPTEGVILYDQVCPGDILAFAVHFSNEGEKYTIESTLKNFKAEFAPYGNSLMALVPVNWWTSPGDYHADIYVESDGARKLFKEYSIKVLPDNFVTEYQYLEVSDELKEKTDPAKTINDGVIVAEAKSNPNPTSYLEGTFIMPIDGELGTSYAMTRYINGANPYRHSGLDIDGEMGDPIVAGNNGVIVYAGPLVRPGNTVIIDHGMGLYSSYLHMSGFAVEAGDYVEKGEVVGYIGSTGFSTGPHLHWSVTMNGNYLSPLWLIENPLVPE